MTDARVTVQEQQGWSAFTAGPVHVLVAWDGRHPALAPREDGLQDFVHLTGSVGGRAAETDEAVVHKILESARVSR